MNVSYDKKELKTILPHLMEELVEGKKAIKIDSVDFEIEEPQSNIDDFKECLGEDLSNPKAIDFLRRCHTKEQAYEILDYLFDRNEITKKEYNNYKKRISKESGLSNLIKESGGFKKPGYYMRKYYYKNSKKNL
ncbi:MAG: DUF2095 family protein [Candidatus Lokiarchaeota archaeon]